MNLGGWLAVPIVACPIGMCVISVIASLGPRENVTWKVINPTIGAVYLGMLLWMGFWRGTNGPNKYGQDPRVERQKRVKYYRKAAANGDEDAKEALKNLGVDLE